MLLPNSPVRKIHKCHNCGDISVYFYDPKHNRAFTPEEWETVLIEGIEALRKIIKPLQENPTFFMN